MRAITSHCARVGPELRAPLEDGPQEAGHVGDGVADVVLVVGGHAIPQETRGANGDLSSLSKAAAVKTQFAAQIYPHE